MLDIKDIIVMDQSCAIYFQFGENKEDADCKTQYLLSTPPDSGFQDPARLTLRELVAFLCWRGLRGHKVDMQTFDDKGKGLSSVAERYADIGKPADPFPKSRKRPGDDGGHEGRRVLPRRNTRGTGTREGEEALFKGWAKDSLVVLQRVPDEGNGPLKLNPTLVRDESFDSGFDELNSSLSQKVSKTFRPFRPPIGATAVTFKVIRLITPLVAVLSTCSETNPRLTVAKLFAPHPLSPELLQNELRVYNHCQDLQGCEIPYCYGVWRLIEPQALFHMALLMEYIDPGTTLDDLLEDIRLAEYEEDYEEAVKRLARARPGAEKALQALHDRCVSHNDAFGRNMIVSGTDVVIVDFDVAIVFAEEPERCKRRQWENWAILGSIFRILEEEDEEEVVVVEKDQVVLGS